MIWLLLPGIPIALSHIFFGIIQALTIIGIGNAIQHFRLAGLALWPFGRKIRSQVLPTKVEELPRFRERAATPIRTAHLGRV